MTTTFPLGQVREFFLLRDARATAGRVAAGARSELGERIQLGRQRAEAADALWSNGHTAEGLRLAAQAFETTMEAVPMFVSALGMTVTPSKPPPAPMADPAASDPSATADTIASDAASPVLPEPGWAAALRSRGLTGAKLDDVRVADDALNTATLPALDEDIGTAHGELFQQLLNARRRVDAVIAPAAATPAQLRITQAVRIGVTVLLAAAAVVGVYLVVRTPEGIEATASAQWAPDLGAPNVLDGNPTTEWLLPDDAPGWVEVTISPPRRIRTLRLLNAHNRQYNDRATHAYTVEIYANGRVAKTITGSWDAFDVTPQWIEKPVGVSAVERIRVNVRSWHRAGGGLAEIAWR